MKGLKSVPKVSKAQPILLKKNGGGFTRNTTSHTTECLPKENFLYVPIENLQCNPDQPRKAMDEESFKHLVDSIRQHGFLQPIVARAEPNNQYTIVAGHRRYDAAREIGMFKVPVLLCDVKGEDFLVKALVENIQREDLHCVDLVRALAELKDRVGHQKVVAEMVGMGYAAVRQYLRATQLDPKILDEAASLPNISRNDLLRLLELSPEEGLRVLQAAKTDSAPAEAEVVDSEPTEFQPGSQTTPWPPTTTPEEETNSSPMAHGRSNVRPPVVPLPYKQTTLDIRSSGKRVVELQIRFFDGRSGTIDELETVLLDALSKVREERKNLGLRQTKAAKAS
jgi:ParB/RepB/Spo0J family partition protein